MGKMTLASQFSKVIEPPEVFVLQARVDGDKGDIERSPLS
jgi:hypothetical protein